MELIDQIRADREKLKALKNESEQYTQDLQVKSIGVLNKMHTELVNYTNRARKLTKMVDSFAKKVDWTGKYIPLPKAVSNYRSTLKNQREAEKYLKDLGNKGEKMAALHGILSSVDSTISKGRDKHNTSGFIDGGNKKLHEVFDSALKDIREASDTLAQEAPKPRQPKR